MNCLSSRPICLLILAILAGCGAPASEPVPGSERYGLTYRVTPEPRSGSVMVELEVTQGERLLREMRFDANPDYISDLAGDGTLSISKDRVTWSPPAAGGVLRWRANVVRPRNDNGYDAWLDMDWGLFRAEDIIPRAATRTVVGALSDSRLHFTLPRGWSVVTEYREKDGQMRVTRKGRRFAQPSGWIVLGNIGIRRDTIAGIRVAVAGPENQGVRRVDMLALMNWTLPELANIVAEMPKRLTIVSAGAPMWRGGLSGPQSLFIHAERPLISENGTSTLLHEVMHVVMEAGPAGDNDWIVEGLAEFYSLQLLVRSGSISARRYEHALEQQAAWARDATSLCGPASSGAVTALAVTVFARLDEEIRRDSDSSLDDVLQQMLMSDKPVDLGLLRATVNRIVGQNPDALHIDRLPGCRSIAATGGAPD